MIKYVIVLIIQQTRMFSGFARFILLNKRIRAMARISKRVSDAKRQGECVESCLLKGGAQVPARGGQASLVSPTRLRQDYVAAGQNKEAYFALAR